MWSGIASSVFTPIYGLASNLGQVSLCLSYGLYLITTGHLTIRSFDWLHLYVNSFYNPLRQLATVWSSLQLALASLDRIQDVLALSSNMLVIRTRPIGKWMKTPQSLSSKMFRFHIRTAKHLGPWRGAKKLLKNINFKLEKGRTYALVGPTGGGRRRAASIMARLYDATEGQVLLNGKDIRSISAD